MGKLYLISTCTTRKYIGYIVIITYNSNTLIYWLVYSHSFLELNPQCLNIAAVYGLLNKRILHFLYPMELKADQELLELKTNGPQTFDDYISLKSANMFNAQLLL